MIDPLIGRRIGPYTLRARLGGGGMGTVYEAEHELLEQVRALKVMAPNLANHPSFVTLFRREAMLAARLRHPNIVQVHDVGDQDGLHYIVMEHLTGRSLRDVVRAESPLAVDRVVMLLKQLAEALDFAHSQRVSHRDIKPANIFVNDSDRVTLVDFGIARAADGTHLTITSGIGTPEYMAPESFDDEILGPDADPFTLGVGTDRYALGVVAYELLSGRAPFAGRTPQSIAFAQVHRTPPPLRQRRPDLPDAAEPVMQRQLAKDPTARYATADEFVRELDAALHAAPSSIGVTEIPTRPAATPMPPPSQPGTATTPARPPEPLAPPTHRPDRSRTPVPAPPPSVGSALVLPPAVTPDAVRAGRRPLIAVGAVAALLIVFAVVWLARPLVDGSSSRAGGPTTSPAAERGTPGVVAGAATTPVSAPPTPAQAAAGATATAASVAAPPPTTAPATMTPVLVTPTRSPAQRLAAADEALKRGDSGGAIEMLLALKMADPATPGLDDALFTAYTAHGQRLLDTGDLDGSWTMYGQALELRPDAAAPRDGQTEVILAKQWRTMEAAWGRDDDAALAAAEDIFRIRPTYQDIREKLYALLVARADRLQQQEDRGGAYTALLQAVEVRPDGIEARERLRSYTPTPAPPTPTPVPVRPAQSAPAQSAPAQQAPAQQAPAQPAQSAPAPAPPAQPAPAQPAQPGGAPIRR